MKYLEAYKDFIDSGQLNNVYEIDDDWILKEPQKVGEGTHGIENHSVIYSHFKDHIQTMKKYPDIFPKVKMLNVSRAAVQRLDTKTAKEQIKHIYYMLYNFFPQRFEQSELCNEATHNDKVLNLLKEERDEICNDWYDFIVKSRNSELFKFYGNSLDLHQGNFGIDKEGNIKLLDF